MLAGMSTPTRDRAVLVAGPEFQARVICAALRSRGISAWSDRTERVLEDRVSLAWADVIVMIDDLAQRGAHREGLDRIVGPKLLVSTVPLDAHHRAGLIEAEGFEYVIDWTAPVECIAAFVERTIHRGALPLRFASGI